MTAAPTRPERREWTVDDLGELPGDLRHELINGRLILPSPTHLHQDLCVRVLRALEANCPPEYVVSIDLPMKVNRSNEPRPDVVALRLDHANRSPVPVEAAILAVEVISPDSTFRDVYDKARVYAHAGVAAYWVIDPLREKITLTELLLGPNDQYEPSVETDGLVTIDRPWKVTLDLPAWSDRRTEVRARGERG